MNETGQKAPSDGFRERLLDAMLEIAAETGWTEAALARAAAKAGLTNGQVQLATPNGVSDLLEALGARAGRAAEERLSRPDVPDMKVRDKVRTAVRAYLAALEPHKPAVKRAASSPSNLLAGPRGELPDETVGFLVLDDHRHQSTRFEWDERGSAQHRSRRGIRAGERAKTRHRGFGERVLSCATGLPAGARFIQSTVTRASVPKRRIQPF